MAAAWRRNGQAPQVGKTVRGYEAPQFLPHARVRNPRNFFDLGLRGVQPLVGKSSRLEGVQHAVVGADEDEALRLLARSISARSTLGVRSAGLAVERSTIRAIHVIGLNLRRGIDDVPQFPYIFGAGGVSAGRTVTVHIAGSVVESGPVGTDANSPAPAAT